MEVDPGFGFQDSVPYSGRMHRIFPVLWSKNRVSAYGIRPGGAGRR